MTKSKRKSGKPKRQWALPGDRYTLAYMLVAAGKLTEEEIAAKLDVSVSALREAMSKPYFRQKVEENRRTDAVLQSHNMPHKSSGELVELVLRAQPQRASGRDS